MLFRSPIEGARIPVDIKPEYLILDGQQRMTSLYLAISSDQAVPTTTNKGKEIQRFYYLDIKRCLDPKDDRLDAVVSVPHTKMVTSDFGRKIELDLNDPESEYEKCLFPLAALFDSSRCFAWRRDFSKFHGYDPDMLSLWDQFEGL